jgi:hypothetical protein
MLWSLTERVVAARGDILASNERLKADKRDSALNCWEFTGSKRAVIAARKLEIVF